MISLDNFVEDACRLFDERKDNSMDVPAALMARRDGDAADDACGMRVFQPVLVGVADAQDPVFEEFRKPEAVGSSFMLPGEWVEGSKSVVSVFFPFSQEICISNREPGVASPEWQYAKFQGTKIIGEFCKQLCDELSAAGWEAVMPVGSGRFAFNEEPCEFAGEADFMVSSVWSERHAAYACGLGTFGLSRGLITRKGMAGRFGSIVTNAPIPPTPREYTDIYEWCTFCGACARKCPAEAISLTDGKCNSLCRDWCVAVGDGDVYGDACGKCQVGVPCTSRKPVSLRPKPRPRD